MCLQDVDELNNEVGDGTPMDDDPTIVAKNGKIQWSFCNG